MSETPALKDEDAAQPVASAWRPTLNEIVRAFMQGDYSLTRGIPSVAPVSSRSEKQIKSYLEEFGQTLTELPDDAWTTSIAQWMRTHWEVVVDLWTKESGASDLTLNVNVFEENGGYRFEIVSVHVP